MQLTLFVKFAKSFLIIPNFITEREGRALYGVHTVDSKFLGADSFTTLVVECFKKMFDKEEASEKDVLDIATKYLTNMSKSLNIVC